MNGDRRRNWRQSSDPGRPGLASAAGGGGVARRRLVVGRREELADRTEQVLGRLGRVEDRLVLRDVVLDRAHLADVDRADLHAAELLDLAVGREDAGAVGAQLAVLVHDAELEREPEDVGDELQPFVGLDALRGLAREALELGEARAREHVPVADDLVDDVRLGRVERLGGMADVLRRVEDAMRERAVELAQRDEAGRRVVLEAGQRLQARRDLVELGHPVLGQRESGLRLEELAAGVLLVLRAQLAADRSPDLVLDVGVGDLRDRLAGRPARRRGRDLVAPLAVGGVVEARVLLAEVDDRRAVLALCDRRVQLCLFEHLAPFADDLARHLSTARASLQVAHGTPGTVHNVPPLPRRDLRNMPSPIDPLDARIITALREEPRIGVLELSRRLGVARGTVTARLEKLQARGVVTAFGPDPDPAELGYPVLAFVFLEIVQGRLDDAVGDLQDVPEVLEAHSVTGARDLLCRVVARDNGHLQDVINRMVRHPAVRRSTSYISMSRQIAYRDAPLVAAAGAE